MRTPDARDAFHATLMSLTSLETEMAVLGRMLVSAADVIACDPRLTADHFSEPLHQRMFTDISRRFAAGEPCDAVAMSSIYASDESFAELGGASTYIGKLASMAAPVVDLPGYARLLADLAERRALVQAAHDAVAQAQDMDTAPSDLAHDVMMRTLEARAGGRDSLHSLAAAMDAAMANAEAARRGEGGLYIPTGIARLDNLITGIPQGEVTLIAGRPAMGKSAVACSLALRLARAGVATVVFSLEMAAARLASRILSNVTAERYSMQAVPYRDIIAGRLNEEQMDRLRAAQADIAGLPLTICDATGLTMADLQADVLRWIAMCQRAGQQPRAVILDYIGLLKPSDRYMGRRVDEVTELSAGLKSLAVRHNLAVVALSQLNRAVESRSDKRPTMADLRDSGALEQDAHTIILLYRDDYYAAQEKGFGADMTPTTGDLEMIVSKNRNGPTGTATVPIDIATNRIG